MLAPLTLEPIALAARSVHRIENAKGIRVSCVRGVDLDHAGARPARHDPGVGSVGGAGPSGLAVVYAFKDAMITVGAAWQLPRSPQPAGIGRDASMPGLSGHGRVVP